MYKQVRPLRKAAIRTTESTTAVVEAQAPKPARKRARKGKAKPAAAPRTRTPMQLAYEGLKAQYPDALLLFRMGDFYELFHADAEIGSKVLGLTLTTRNRSSETPIPMAGFPYHQLDGYLRKLVAAGHRVAVAEQVTDSPPRPVEVHRVEVPGGLVEPTAAETPTTAPTSAPVAAQPVEGETPTPRKASGLGAIVGRAKAAPVDTPTVAGTQAPHLVVEARAGSGKTFTLVIGLAYMVRDHRGGAALWHTCCKMLGFTPVPSPQQQAVWDALRVGTLPQSVAYLAFNKSIVEEFSRKYAWLVAGLKSVGVMLSFSTVHSLGNAAVRRGFRGSLKLNKWKSQNLMEVILGCDIREYRRSPSGATVVNAVDDLVSKCKLNLTGARFEYPDERAAVLEVSPTDEELGYLCSRYEIDVNGQRDKVYDLTRQVLARSMDNPREIDFDDMVWLPTVCGLHVPQADLVLGDEAQDWNRSQQAIIAKAGNRLVVCGDPKQAIYGFAGADTDSIPRMTEQLRASGSGVEVLPLTVTRRCGKVIVAKAAEIVPDFEAHESNAEGEIVTLQYDKVLEGVADGDMVLCRVNAPMISMAFKLLKMGRKANIKGRDIGEGLIKLVNKLAVGSEEVGTLIEALDAYYHAESAKLMRQKYPSDDALIALQDKRDCVLAFCEGVTTVQEIRDTIKRLFDDNTSGGVLLSSVHRAKGLEADRVFILRPELMPHPMAKSQWAQEQEQHLRYVAITRAIRTLVWVEGDKA